MNPYLLIALGMGLYFATQQKEPPPSTIPDFNPTPPPPPPTGNGLTRATVPWPGQYVNPDGYIVSVNRNGTETWTDKDGKTWAYQNILPDPRWKKPFSIKGIAL